MKFFTFCKVHFWYSSVSIIIQNFQLLIFPNSGNALYHSFLPRAIIITLFPWIEYLTSLKANLWVSWIPSFKSYISYLKSNRERFESEKYKVSPANYGETKWNKLIYSLIFS